MVRGGGGRRPDLNDHNRHSDVNNSNYDKRRSSLRLDSATSNSTTENT